MKIRLTKRSAQQIETILEFIRDSSPTGASNVAARLDAVLTLLKEQLGAGRQTDIPTVRRLAITPYPYVLFYRLTESEVVILRVLHTSRRKAAG